MSIQIDYYGRYRFPNSSVQNVRKICDVFNSTVFQELYAEGLGYNQYPSAEMGTGLLGAETVSIRKLTCYPECPDFDEARIEPMIAEIAGGMGLEFKKV